MFVQDHVCDTAGSLKKGGSMLLGDGDPDWTAAVEQLAWEKDLNLAAGGAAAGVALLNKAAHNGPTPLDEAKPPLDSSENGMSNGASTETTTVSY